MGIPVNYHQEDIIPIPDFHKQRPDLIGRLRFQVYDRHGYFCHACGKEAHSVLLWRQRRKNGEIHESSGLHADPVIMLGEIGRTAARILTLDHVIPRCYGGTKDLDNLQPLCNRCNGKKKANLLLEDERIQAWIFGLSLVGEF